MSWQLAVLARIFTAHICTPVLMKKITGLPSRARRLSLQFMFCAIFSFAFAAMSGGLAFNKYWLIIAGIGVVNCLAAYCQWRAVDINLSKTALFTQADDIITVSLGYIILGEAKYLNSTLAMGVALCFITSTAIVMSKYKTADKKGGNVNAKLIGWIAVYSVIWGVAVFTMRYFALNGVSFSTFLTAWYSGSYIGSLLILFLPQLAVKIATALKLKSAQNLDLAVKKEIGEKLTKTGAKSVLVLSLAIWFSMFFGYHATKLAPLTVSQPIFLASEMILPALIGLWIFKELKELNMIERIAFPVGIIGGLIIGMAF